MTDFDKIIKQKVEGKKYPYSASAWQSFASKAGIKSALTLGQSIIIGAVSFAVISVGGIALYKHLSSNESTPIPVQPAQSTEIPEAVVSDTLIEQSEMDSVIETQPVINTNASTKQVVKQNDEQDKNPVIKQDTIEKTTKKPPILRPKNNRRILEIRTDTIKSNY